MTHPDFLNLQSLTQQCRDALNAAHDAVDCVENGTMTVAQLREANAAYEAAFKAVIDFRA
jgi:hypothetical protein